MWLNNECLAAIQKAQGSTPSIKIVKIQLKARRDGSVTVISTYCSLRGPTSGSSQPI